MIAILTQMFTLIVCGIGWRLLQPAGLTADQTRFVLTNLVYYLLLPALVLSVLWRAQLGIETLTISLVTVASVLFGALLFWTLFRLWSIPRAQAGAVMLAAIFPNITYLGLPVLEQTFGSWARSIAIQMDLFGGTPLLLTLGVTLCRQYGHNHEGNGHLLLSLLRVPSLWAALLAALLNSAGVPMPAWLEGLLELLARGVVPLMLFSLGLGLHWTALRWRNLPKLAPVMLMKLLIQPLFALMLASSLGLEGDVLAAVVLEVAMPCMVLGLVFCDRYGLDTPLYAMAVTVSTALSLLSLPLWYRGL